MRILQRGLERSLCDARGLRGNADAPAIQRRKRHSIAFAFVAYAIGHWHRAIGKDQLATRGGVDAQLLFFFSDFEPRRALFHHQCGDSFFAFGWLRVHIHNRRVRRPAVGDPRFRSVENVVVTLFHRLGLQRCGV